LDLAGHGESGGKLGQDSTNGALVALNYLKKLNNVDPTRLGVIGHSLGAGSARVLASQEAGVIATIFLGGGVSSSNFNSTSNPITATSPKNMLIVVGEHDVLFNINSLESSLKPVFNTTDKIVREKLYGNFKVGNARELLILSTIHLLEPLDPYTITKSVGWLNSAFIPEINPSLMDTTYLLREIALILGLIMLISAIIPISQIYNKILPGRIGEEVIVRHRFLRERTVLFAWGFLGVLLFIPAMLGGALLPFPTLLIGASMAWWLMLSGVIGLIILIFLSQRRLKEYKDLRKIITSSFKYRDIGLAFLIILTFYIITSLTQIYLQQKIRIFVPILPMFNLSRLTILPQFIPFYFIYFLVDGLYLNVYRTRQSAGSTLGNFLRTLMLKISPYIILLGLQYIPMYLFGIRLIPSFAAFFVEFLFAIIPMLIISTFTSWWLYRYTKRIGVGVIFNTLLFAWITAGLFPFGGFA
ncbi:hypothetical protein FJY84_03295, partial [Candidatus Bathyarchaeota archaeon]|nr:hypothetical protein [Candidatus Bathyarchaeota archaeon]